MGTCPLLWVWGGMGTKGQLIVKWFFRVIDFLQKTNEQIRLYYYDTSGSFFGGNRQPKKTILKLTDH